MISLACNRFCTCRIWGSVTGVTGHAHEDLGGGSPADWVTGEGS